jgi:hypothetical protein
MIRALALVCLVAACAPTRAPVALPDLRSCPIGAAIPVPPAKPRTVEAISAWGNRNQTALRRTLGALTECERLRAGLADWIAHPK